MPLKGDLPATSGLEKYATVATAIIFGLAIGAPLVLTVLPMLLVLFSGKIAVAGKSS